MTNIAIAEVSVTQISVQQVTDGMSTFTVISVTTRQYLVLVIDDLIVTIDLTGVRSEGTCEVLIEHLLFV